MSARGRGEGGSRGIRMALFIKVPVDFIDQQDDLPWEFTVKHI